MKGHQKHRLKTTITIMAMIAMVLVWPFCTYAQQDPVYSQYMNNISSINPAYTGVRNIGSLTTINRKQWMGIENAPFTSSLTFGMPLDSLGKVGGGLDFIYDNQGPVTYTGLFLDYSYRIRASETSMLSFGIKGGANYLQSNLTQLDRYHFDDQYILNYGDYTRWLANFGVGLYWYSDDFYVGFSVPRLMQNRFHRDVIDLKAASREERHYFINGGYLFRLTPSLSFKPGFSSILVAGAPATAHFDFGFLLKEKVWLGTMYRISDSVGAYAQFQLENFKVGLAYEYPLTDLGYYSTGTIEVMLRFEFKTKSYQVFPLPAF